MSLSVSIDGGDRIPAESVVLYDEGIPIAGALMHGPVVFYADSIRDPADMAKILDQLGIRIGMAQRANFNIQGNLDI